MTDQPDEPRRSELLILPWKCPFCIGGLGPSLDGGAERCMHCSGIGLTDDPCGPAERAPRPPAVMRAPCADCAYRSGSPEREALGTTLPEDEPFFCHQGLPVSALGAYTPVATFRGLPLGAMVCAGWWAMRTGEPLPSKPYREIPITEDDVEKRWGRTATTTTEPNGAHPVICNPCRDAADGVPDAEHCDEPASPGRDSWACACQHRTPTTTGGTQPQA